MKLAEYLATNQIPQREFADAIGVKQATISRYVLGQRWPSRDQLLKIREATAGAVTADDFLGMEAAE